MSSITHITNPTPENITQLFQEICDIKSVSGKEDDLADAIQDFLEVCAKDYRTDREVNFEVIRHNNQVIARTKFNRASRIILAGHIDTVPISLKTDNFPSKREGNILRGRGTVDMKGGDAYMLALAATLTNPKYDVTYIFYDNEEVDASSNGLGHIERDIPEFLEADFAILGEPTGSVVEGGCNGSLRFDVQAHGKAAHSARSWMGENAIHKLAPVLEKLNEWNEETRIVPVEGLEYREGLNATIVTGGIAPNVIPDEAVLHINYRFAPDKTVEEAKRLMLQLFETDDYTVEFRDISPAARPGLDRPQIQEFANIAQSATSHPPRAKLGWTDVARFSVLGIPAVNFGPGDPLLCHHDDEHCNIDEVFTCYTVLQEFLSE